MVGDIAGYDPKERAMKVIVKASNGSEAGEMPSAALTSALRAKEERLHNDAEAPEAAIDPPTR